MITIFQCVVEIAAMIADGLGVIGNTKAAILRLGMLEIRKIADLYTSM